MTARRVCVFTGTRADYGLLRWVMHEVREHPSLALQTLVTGSHLAPEYGSTVQQIERDGFVVDERVEALLSGDTPTAAAISMGLTTAGCAAALDRLRPDVLVVLGDRYEALAVAQAAVLLDVPVAHLHGGESTEGAVDEQFRHAVTKLSSLHLPAAEPFARRIRQMGEEPARVTVVGAPGLDNVRRLDLLDRAALESDLGLPLGRSVVVTYHPVTLAPEGVVEAAGALMEVLDRTGDLSVVLTRPNADPQGRMLAGVFERWAAARPERVRLFDSLGQVRYLSAVRNALAVVGNSSSGLIEAPALGTPTVNLGDRQAGRLRGRSVVDCDETVDSIGAALQQVLDPAFRVTVAGDGSPYGDGRTAPRVAQVLADVDLQGITRKRFHDL